MFYKASFKAWHKQVKLYIERRQWEQDQAALKEKSEQIGKKYVEVPFEVAPVITKDIVCEWDQESIYTLSDDEATPYHQQDHEDEFNKSHRSGGKLMKLSMFSSFRSQSPNVFRKNASQRMSQNKLKYPHLMAMAQAADDADDESGY